MDYKTFASLDRNKMALLRSLIATLTSSTLQISVTPRYSGLRLRADASNAPIAANQTTTNQTTRNNEKYSYQELAGYGFLPYNKYSDTLVGYGSAIAIDRSWWQKSNNGSYTLLAGGYRGQRLVCCGETFSGNVQEY